MGLPAETAQATDTIKRTHEFHPAADLFPLIEVDSTAFAELVQDIRENGLLDSIELFEGKILDGRNRYRACQHAGVEPRFEQWKGDDPYHHVISRNLYRRHLTDDQRAMIAVAALPELEREAKKHQGSRTDLELDSTQGKAKPNASRRPAAETFEVSQDQARR